MIEALQVFFSAKQSAGDDFHGREKMFSSLTNKTDPATNSQVFAVLPCFPQPKGLRFCEASTTGSFHDENPVTALHPHGDGLGKMFLCHLQSSRF